MARYMRGQPQSLGHSQIRTPAVVAPAVTFPGPQTELAQVRLRPQETVQRRAPHSVIRPPAVVAPPVQFQGWKQVPGPAVRLQTERERRQVQWTPINPAIINPGVTFRAVQVTLAEPRRPKPKSVLRPPAVVAAPAAPFFAAPPRLTFTRTDLKRRGSHSRIQPPAVIAPPTTNRPELATLSGRTSIERVRRAPHYKLAPPAVVAPQQTQPTVTQLRITLAVGRVQTEQPRRAANSNLRAPAVVGPATVFAALTVKLAPSKRGKPKSQLRGPATLDRPFFQGPKIRLAPSKRGTPKSRIRPPAVVGAATTFRAFTRRLAGRTRLEQEKRKSHAELNPPAVTPTIIVVGVFDRPTPSGRSGGNPGAGGFDRPTPGRSNP